MKKDQILAVLRAGHELSLSEIYEKICLDSFDEQTLSKPLILHHLTKMVRDGIIIKNDKKYKITNIGFGQGDSLNVDALDTIVLPRIVARAGAAEKVIPDTIDTGAVKLNKNRYKPEDLIGKSVVIVANLKPRTLCGVESKGMVLAGEITEDDIKVLFVDGMPAGTMLG